ncbi:hypothetical protein RDI58_024595 [Solanum bulbocastanum]|uniref:Uncharacterized protein n=1 Tax=Solanum bulbocastanum TaxID=147425 RepID=A0AAN8T272_SOLBU
MYHLKIRDMWGASLLSFIVMITYHHKDSFKYHSRQQINIPALVLRSSLVIFVEFLCFKLFVVYCLLRI